MQQFQIGTTQEDGNVSGGARVVSAAQVSGSMSSVPPFPQSIAAASSGASGEDALTASFRGQLSMNEDSAVPPNVASAADPSAAASSQAVTFVQPRVRCPVQGCPHAGPPHEGYADVASMREHLNRHATGSLHGAIPPDFMRTHRLDYCSVCSRTIHSRYRGVCPGACRQVAHTLASAPRAAGNLGSRTNGDPQASGNSFQLSAPKFARHTPEAG